MIEYSFEILQGAADLHVHGAPDTFERPFDEVELAKRAKAAGYRALLFKSHFTTNADRVFVVSKIVEGIELFGNLTLNLSVGGINPQAVFHAVKLGAKEIKMPTVHAANHIEHMGQASYPHKFVKLPSNMLNIKGISILDSDGQPIPELYDVLGLVADNEVILGTGHLSRKEVMALVKEATSAGVQKIVVTHADYLMQGLSTEDQRKLADMGAYIEHCFAHCMPHHKDPLKMGMIVENIRAVGPEHCIISSDFGQFQNPPPVEGMMMFIYNLLGHGIDEKEINLMLKTNPAKLLNLH